MTSGASGRLTTHVLDTMHGRPGRGILVELFRLRGEDREPLLSVRTNEDGRCDRPLLHGDELQAGTYEIVFHIGEYFQAEGVSSGAPRFLDLVPVRFGIASPDEHYHVPLLVTPYGYSTYRGS